MVAKLAASSTTNIQEPVTTKPENLTGHSTPSTGPGIYRHDWAFSGGIIRNNNTKRAKKMAVEEKIFPLPPPPRLRLPAVSLEQLALLLTMLAQTRSFSAFNFPTP